MGRRTGFGSTKKDKIRERDNYRMQVNKMRVRQGLEPKFKGRKYDTRTRKEKWGERFQRVKNVYNTRQNKIAEKRQRDELKNELERDQLQRTAPKYNFDKDILIHQLAKRYKIKQNTGFANQEYQKADYEDQVKHRHRKDMKDVGTYGVGSHKKGFYSNEEKKRYLKEMGREKDYLYSKRLYTREGWLKKRRNYLENKERKNKNQYASNIVKRKGVVYKAPVTGKKVSQPIEYKSQKHKPRLDRRGIKESSRQSPLYYARLKNNKQKKGRRR